jgi:hypothetical protein
MSRFGAVACIRVRVAKTLLIASLALGAGISSAAAGYIGTTATVDYEWPTIGIVLYPGGSLPVTSGGTTFSLSGGDVLVDVSNTSIDITFPAGWSFSTAPKSFDGLVITDSAAIVTGVSLRSTNISGFDSSDTSSNSKDVFVNFPYPPFSGLNSGANIILNVSFAPVPEPPATAFLLVGVLSIGAVRFFARRHRPPA